MSSLEEAAAARKEKLLALRKRKAEASASDSQPAQEDETPAAKQARLDFKFRAYDPATGQARKHNKADEEETVESATKDLIKEALEDDAERRKQELDLFNIQPKKPNWDLKRDLDKRLEKLKPKTQSAINTLIRQRLGAAKKGTTGTEASAGGEDMAEAIARRTIDEEAGAMSDEDEV